MLPENWARVHVGGIGQLPVFRCFRKLEYFVFGKEGSMRKSLSVLTSYFILAIAFGFSQAQEAPPAPPPAPETAAKATPADGHVIHVTAPHLIDGKVRGPFHH